MFSCNFLRSLKATRKGWEARGRGDKETEETTMTWKLLKEGDDEAKQ